MNYIGKTVIAKDGSVGTVYGIAQEYCAGCGKNKRKLRILWNDGKRTRPCLRHVVEVDDKLQLI